MKNRKENGSSGSDKFHSIENSSEESSSSEDSEETKVNLTYKNCLWS